MGLMLLQRDVVTAVVVVVSLFGLFGFSLWIFPLCLEFRFEFR